MYVTNGEVIVRFHENLAVVEPIHLEGKIVDNPTYGHIDVELFNDTTRPILIDRGIISISLNDFSIQRNIVSILPSDMVNEHPLCLPAQARSVHTVLFDFMSGDCLAFDFDVYGNMPKPVKLQITLADTDDNRYVSDEIKAIMIAKGDVLHKVKLKNYYENKESLSFKDKLKFWLNR